MRSCPSESTRTSPPALAGAVASGARVARAVTCAAGARSVNRSNTTVPATANTAAAAAARTGVSQRGRARRARCAAMSATGADRSAGAGVPVAAGDEAMPSATACQTCSGGAGRSRSSRVCEAMPATSRSACISCRQAAQSSR
jgi:hypothetical protein